MKSLFHYVAAATLLGYNNHEYYIMHQLYITHLHLFVIYINMAHIGHHVIYNVSMAVNNTYTQAQCVCMHV